MLGMIVPAALLKCLPDSTALVEEAIIKMIGEAK
jgi:hypothetical protein